MLPKLRLTGIVGPDGDAYRAFCPELPEIQTFASTEEEAWRMLDDAIRLVLEDRVASGEELPTEPVHVRPLHVEA